MKAMTNLFIFAVLLGYSSAVHADVKVNVLGIRSVEGDDEFANNLTAALRAKAAQVEGWQVSDRTMSLAQVGLAYGCEEPDATCLKEIAAGLETDILIYGTVRRTSAGENFNYSVTLNIFHGKTGGIENTVVEIIRSSNANPEGLAASSVKLLGMLVRAPQEKTGAIFVQVNVPEAEVRLDGRAVGKTTNGSLTLEGIAAGEYKLEIVAPGYLSDQRQIRVTESEQTSVAGNLALAPAGQEVEATAVGPANKPPASLKWLGWTLVGVSGASLIGAVVSWAMIGSINGDSTFDTYRRRIGASPEGVNVTDVCKEAEKGNSYADSRDPQVIAQAESDVADVKSMCHRASTFEVLQYVFLAVALVSGGAGAYVLITESGRSERKQNAGLGGTNLTIRPQLSPYAGSLSARLEF